MQIRALLAGLRDLGFQVRESSEPCSSSFFPGVWCEAGILIVHESAHAGHVIHEAGHLAVIPGELRTLAEGNFELGPLGSALEEREKLHLLADEPVLAWSYAAARRLDVGIPLLYGADLPPSLQPFGGQGTEIGPQIFACIRRGWYLGIRDLELRGMCRPGKWPQMRRWMAP